MPNNEKQRPIIIKRKTVAGDGAHHGGAWKVAYADFVTAMMAFFLLMWLLNATTEDQRKGLADYFNPNIPISRTSAGGTGMLAGVSIVETERMAGPTKVGVPPKPTHHEPGKRVEDDVATPADAVPGEHPAHPGAGNVADRTQDEAASLADGGGPAAPDDPAHPYDTEALAAEQAERERLEKISRDIEEAMRAAENRALKHHFQLHITPEGLVIEIVDADDRPLFDSASAKPAPVLELLAGILVPILNETLNDIAVVGHTDAVPFGRASYSNWELSADRANAARRLLIRLGLPEKRVVRVTGKAAVEPLAPDPNASQNRRIAVTLLRAAAR